MQKESCNKVSVIIPVYKVEKYLDECVQSVLNQTYKNLEIILVDDGSPDNCPKMCDEYAKADQRVRVIHKENGGLSSARNSGIEIATGDYIFFLDSDDYLGNDIIESLVSVALKHNAKITACGYTSDSSKIDNGKNYEVFNLSKEQSLKCILKEKIITTSAWGKLYKAKLFETIRFPNGKIYEDLGTTYKVIELVDQVVVIDSRKYYYRVNPVSITQSNFSKKQLDYYDIVEELERFVSENYKKYLRLVKNHVARNSISFMRKVSESGFSDKKVIAVLVKNIRKNIFGYMFSNFSMFSKLYGLFICISPSLALKVFNCNKKD